MSSWETMPRREMWAWAYLTVCVVWLAYNAVLFVRDGKWSFIVMPVCFAVFAGGVVWKARRATGRTEKSDDLNGE